MSGSELHRAVALRWDPEDMKAPRVVASGRGEIAERILAAAAENGIPIREDEGVLELLAAAEVGSEIPVELYSAVAEILSLLYRLDGEARAD